MSIAGDGRPCARSTEQNGSLSSHASGSRPDERGMVRRFDPDQERKARVHARWQPWPKVAAHAPCPLAIRQRRPGPRKSAETGGSSALIARREVPSMAAVELGLVGDVGATNARFALVRPDGSMTAARVYALDDYSSLTETLHAYLADEAPLARPEQAVLAMASPITGDQVTLTNHPWTFSIEAVRKHFGLTRLRVINDFAANAVAISHLKEADRLQVGRGFPVSGAPIGVLGPGTGLGVSALMPTPGGWTPIEGEGGHVTMAPADAQESAVLELMRRRYDHVSAERVLSGAGLVNLYSVLCELAAVPAAPFTAPQITDPGIWAQDSRTRDATAMFCAMLGTVAGNLALILGARGGIYIAGGIVPKLGAAFVQSAFRRRFEAKGRLQSYLAAIPTYVIVRPLPGLVGAAALLGSH
ncbi:MAG: glucokinase [Xanthobacteraceae bacterium]